MTDKSSRFPLSLSSVVEKKNKASAPSSRLTTGTGSTDAPVRTVVTPQTATRNAAQSVGQAAKMTAARVPAPMLIGKTAARTALPPPMIISDRPSPLVSEAVRNAMVARVAKQGVRDEKVLAAMAAVPRHMFMEPALSSQAYIDASLPIGHHQTISQPYIVARMIEIMRDNNKGKALDRVLEIGTGCGYQAAVLSLVAKEIYSIERIKPLHELAKTNLRPLRIPNIRLHYGDGMLGLPQVAPFDGIILAAAGLEVPQALLDQMAIGGRLVAPVGGRQQMLKLIERVGKFEWTSEAMEECHFVPLRPGTV
jgi:protein-L-isoaspartate(D-aspartate) O-methyltransferase